MKKAYGYYRVSTTEQAKEGQSIEAQKKICRNWAKENECIVLEEFLDEGKSATNLNRPALQDMLSKTQDKSVDFIIVQDTDRLARNTFDHLTIKAILEKNGVQVISVSQPMIDDSPEGNLIDTIVASVNTFQSELTGRKTSKVLKEKAKTGWYPGPAPIGYKNTDNPNPKNRFDKRIIDFDLNESSHVKKAFEMYATGNHTDKTIANFLNQKGVKSFYGKAINTSHVANFLKNPFYIGKFQWGGEEYSGEHPKLISKPLFNKVQKVIAEHNKYATRTRKHKFLLRGFLFCSKCKKRYWAEKHVDKQGRTYDSYFCSGCKGKYFKAELLEKQVESLMDQIELSEEYVKKVLSSAKKILKESRANQKTERTNLTKQKNTIEKAIREAEDSRFIHHSITEKQFTKIYTRYEEKLKLIEEETKMVGNNYSNRIKLLGQILRLAENIGNSYKMADFNLKRQYLSLFFESLEIDRKGKLKKIHLKSEVEGLIKGQSILVSKEWLRGLDSNQQP